MAASAPASDADICNLALDELRADTINSIDDVSVEAGVCKRHYERTRGKVLRAHVWNFAKSEAQLARVSGATSNSYDDVYLLPGNFSRFISIGDVRVDTKQIRYDIRSIFADGVYKRTVVIDNGGAATLDILYIRNEKNVSAFDQLFVELFVLELAVAMSGRIVNKPSTLQSIRDRLSLAKLEAKGIDGQEAPPVQFSNSKFLSARRGASRTRPLIYPDF